jgi:hypothetical protein
VDRREFIAGLTIAVAGTVAGGWILEFGPGGGSAEKSDVLAGDSHSPSTTTVVEATGRRELLSHLVPIAGDSIVTDPLVLGGVRLDHPVRFNCDSAGIHAVQYSLDARFKRMTGSVGFAGESESPLQWRFSSASIEGASRVPIFDRVLGNGEIDSFDESIAGVMTLELSIVVASTVALPSDPSTNYPVVWGDVVLVS